MNTKKRSEYVFLEQSSRGPFFSCPVATYVIVPETFVDSVMRFSQDEVGPKVTFTSARFFPTYSILQCMYEIPLWIVIRLDPNYETVDFYEYRHVKDCLYFV